MARLTNGTNQSLQGLAVDLTPYAKITMVMWAWYDVNHDVDEHLIEHGTNSFAFSFEIQINATGVSSNSVYRNMDGASNTQQGTFPRPSAAAWHQMIFEFDRTVTAGNVGVQIWIDNVLQTLTPSATAALTGTHPLGDLNIMSRNNASDFMAGRVTEVAIYGGTLTSYQRQVLQTRSPLVVGSPAFYWPTAGYAVPEPALVGPVAMTVNGATYVDAPAALVPPPMPLPSRKGRRPAVASPGGYF